MAHVMCSVGDSEHCEKLGFSLGNSKVWGHYQNLGLPCAVPVQENAMKN